MHDHWLVLLALCVAAAGMVGLLFVLTFLELPLTDIRTSEAMADGTPVRMQGEVVRVQQRGNISSLILRQPATIEVVIFGNVNASGCVIISGKRSSFKGQAQITASKIARCT
jgi:hypothetical protein